jgi:hypothetical protein
VGNGTDYLLGVPEPRTLELAGLAFAVIAVLARKRSRTS